MSHFTVMVAVDGKHPTPQEAWTACEQALAPFDENLDVPEDVWLSEATVDGYVQHYKDNEESYWYQPMKQRDPKDLFGERVPDGEKRPVITPLASIEEGDLEGFHEWMKELIGWNENGVESVLYDEEKQRWGYRSHYNPKSKWDWYSLGGRWAGSLQLRADVPYDSEHILVGDHYSESGKERMERVVERRVDLARIRDVDWDTATEKARAEANERYDAYEAATEGLEVPPTWDEHRTATFVERGVDPAWLELETRKSLTDDQLKDVEEAMNVARASWGAIPWVKALREARLDAVMGDSHEAWKVRTGGREAYVQAAADSVFTTYAMLTLEGEWVEPGRMGWFGMSSADADSTADFHRTQTSYVKALDPATWIAIVDCHI